MENIIRRCCKTQRIFITQGKQTFELKTTTNFEKNQCINKDSNFPIRNSSNEPDASNKLISHIKNYLGFRKKYTHLNNKNIHANTSEMEYEYLGHLDDNIRIEKPNKEKKTEVVDYFDSILGIFEVEGLKYLLYTKLSIPIGSLKVNNKNANIYLIKKVRYLNLRTKKNDETNLMIIYLCKFLETNNFYYSSIPINVKSFIWNENASQTLLNSLEYITDTVFNDICEKSSFTLEKKQKDHLSNDNIDDFILSEHDKCNLHLGTSNIDRTSEKNILIKEYNIKQIYSAKEETLNIHDSGNNILNINLIENKFTNTDEVNQNTNSISKTLNKSNESSKYYHQNIEKDSNKPKLNFLCSDEFIDTEKRCLPKECKGLESNYEYHWNRIEKKINRILKKII
ncbi:hypothetical protein EDEG_00387 [Edhazardia aedis USNM 41457]|uniref:Uncharacterized protein n=1 Tax=Edhazardia aedis (strain USNM 41457) TaxID=1003232 RepID=J9D1K4_EDHAE|nr:hypothetical protein EDEG_00387 [Edhazardia aedis USNM 41457]|eukprot:EJW01721.1 hypothetical protein EDEG_00387 [Edhazardia aedis USNM 41457]